MVVAFARTAVKEQCPLRGASLVFRSASLTASSLRLPLFYGGASAPPFSSSDSEFSNVPRSWRSCRLKKIALGAPYGEVF
jgi:hypothetical protein